jgi:hypothetical protein
MGKKRAGIFGQKVKRLLFSPSVLLPAVAGGFFSLLAWGGVASGFLWPGLSLLGLAAFVATLRWTWGRRNLDHAALEALLQQQEREQQARLKSVRRLMRRDRDPRTSQMVKHLKSVFERLWSLTPDPVDEWKQPPQVYEKIAGLYDTCLSMLERSFEFWHAARSVSTDGARHSMLDSRDDLLDQVQTSIGHLDATLDSLQTAQIERRDEALSDRNSRLQQELEQGLVMARAVEKRMEDLEQQLRKIERE